MSSTRSASISRQRFAMLDESFSLITQLWTEPAVTFHGRFWSVTDVRPHLQPWQRPRIRRSGSERCPTLASGARRGSAMVGRSRPRPSRTWFACSHRYEDERTRSDDRRYGIRFAARSSRGDDRGGVRPVRMDGEGPAAGVRAAFLATRNASGDRRRLSGPRAEGEAFLGTPAECVGQIAALAAIAPIDPILVAPSGRTGPATTWSPTSMTWAGTSSAPSARSQGFVRGSSGRGVDRWRRRLAVRALHLSDGSARAAADASRVGEPWPACRGLRAATRTRHGSRAGA